MQCCLHSVDILSLYGGHMPLRQYSVGCIVKRMNRHRHAYWSFVLDVKLLQANMSLSNTSVSYGMSTAACAAFIEIGHAVQFGGSSS